MKQSVKPDTSRCEHGWRHPRAVHRQCHHQVHQRHVQGGGELNATFSGKSTSVQIHIGTDRRSCTPDRRPAPPLAPLLPQVNWSGTGAHQDGGDVGQGRRHHPGRRIRWVAGAGRTPHRCPSASRCSGPQVTSRWQPQRARFLKGLHPGRREAVTDRIRRAEIPAIRARALSCAPSLVCALVTGLGLGTSACKQRPDFSQPSSSAPAEGTAVGAATPTMIGMDPPVALGGRRFRTQPAAAVQPRAGAQHHRLPLAVHAACCR